MPPTKPAAHPLESGTAVVPAFIIKLWKLVEDPSCNHLISWSAAETSFIIKNQADFAKELLPRYFKHSNLASFIRQLNFYGFRKVANIEGRSLQHEKNETEFFHPFFVRQQKGLLCLIKRKVGKVEDALVLPDVQDLMTDVKALQGKQETVDSLLSEMKQENQILWQEIGQLREKHAKQQRIVAKLIQFLATVVQPKSGNLSIKRKMPLMIDVRKTSLSSIDCVSSSKKLKKDICLSAKTNNYNASAKLNNIYDKVNNDLIIHDVTDDNSNDPCFSSSQADYVVESPLTDVTDSGNIDEISCSAVNSLEPLSLLESFQPNNDILDLAEGLTLERCGIHSSATDNNAVEISTLVQQSETGKATLDEKVIQDTNQHNIKFPSQLAETDTLTKAALSEHLQYAGSELDWLHEQLTQGRMNIDTSDVLNLFTEDDCIPENSSLPLLDIFPSHNSPDGIVGDDMLPFLSPPLDFSMLDDPLDDSLPNVLSAVSSIGTDNNISDNSVE